MASYFLSPMAYLVCTGFMLISVFLFFTLLGSFNSAYNEFVRMPIALPEKAPNLNSWVIEGYLHGMVLCLVFTMPLITMRAFADEYAAGTDELLFTAPLTSAQIVWGKFLAAVLLLSVMILLIALLPFLLFLLGNPEGLPIVSGLVGVWACGVLFLSLGFLCASLTSSHIAAGSTALVVIFLMYMFHSPAEVLDSSGAEIIRAISPLWQVGGLIKGIVLPEQFVYFLGMTSVSIFGAIGFIETRRLG